jgi:SAM-dependent methyltransferase
MQNKELWIPTKFVKSTQGYKASSDKKYVAASSYFIASIQAKIYPPAIVKHAKGLLLDLGCGDVPLYGIYQDYVTDNICVDWNNTLHNNQYLDLTADLNAKLPFEDEKFDTILMTEVLEHISNPNQLMSEISRLLKPEGKTIITVPFFYWLHETPHDYFRYTEFALKMFCENNSLKIITLEAYGGAPEILLDIIAKNISGLPKLGSIMSTFGQLFLNSRYGQNISKTSSKSFPLGYTLVAQK